MVAGEASSVSTTLARLNSVSVSSTPGGATPRNAATWAEPRLPAPRLPARSDSFVTGLASVLPSIELATGKITPRAILELKPGDIIPLDTSPTEEATVRIEGQSKYKGFVGTYRGSRALKVTRSVTAGEEG